MITIGVEGYNPGGGIKYVPMFQVLQYAGESHMDVKTHPLTDKCLREMDWNIRRKKGMVYLEGKGGSISGGRKDTISTGKIQLSV